MTRGAARRRLVAVCTALLALALGRSGELAPPAEAQSSIERAKTNFSAGAQAYAAGDYAGAVQAFESAYTLAPRPPVLFSLAQAERKLYVLDRSPAVLASARAHFRQYVEQVKHGGRVADASQALAELEMLAATTTSAGPSKAAAESARRVTRVMVVPSVESARVLIDGQPLGAGEVRPGRHALRVSAEGYFDEVRELSAVEGELLALDIALRERPARLWLVAPADAEVSIDGRPMGVVPLRAHLEVRAGQHVVSLALNGHHAFRRVVDLARGETRSLYVSLAPTFQRGASYGLMAGGLLGLGGGATLLLAAGGRQRDAEQTLAQLDRGQNISAKQLADYQDARDDRDRLRRAGFVGLGVGAGLLSAGLLLFAFDRPAVAAPPPGREAPSTPSSPRREPSGFDALSLVPAAGAGQFGAALVGTFLPPSSSRRSRGSSRSRSQGSSRPRWCSPPSPPSGRGSWPSGSEPFALCASMSKGSSSSAAAATSPSPGAPPSRSARAR